MMANMKVLMGKLDKKPTEIKFSEIIKICLLDKDLPHARGDIYFLVNTLIAFGIFEKTAQGKYKINWVKYSEIAKEGLQ